MAPEAFLIGINGFPNSNLYMKAKTFTKLLNLAHKMNVRLVPPGFPSCTVITNPNPNNRGLWWSTGGENLSQWTPGCEQWDGSLLAIFWSILSLTRDFLLPRTDLVRTDYGPTLFTLVSMVRVNFGRMYWNIMSSEHGWIFFQEILILLSRGFGKRLMYKKKA